MITEFFRFELRQQLRSPLLWLMAVMFALMGFGAAASEAVQLGGGIGNVMRNAPIVIVQWLALFTLLVMLVITLFISGALLRDFEQGTAELFFASPIKKRDYLLGRLGAALLASLLVYVVIATGIFIAQFMPWVDPARLGPVSLTPYLWAFAVFVIPNLLFTGAVIALFAVTTRGILWVYIGVLGFLVLYGVSSALMKDLDNVWLATLLEPLGLRALARTTRYWAAEERNTRLPSMAGYLIANRALRLGMTAVLFAATFALFRTERTGTSGRRFGSRRVKTPVPDAQASSSPVAALPRATPRFGASTAVRQFLRYLRFDVIGVFRSAPLMVMFVFGIANFVANALTAKLTIGTEIYPVTSQMMEALRGGYSWLLVIVALFYAGELVFKERAARISEVTDAMPMPDWVPLAAKFATMVAVIVAFQVVGVIASIAVQLSEGYTRIEPLVYTEMLLVDSVVYILMGGLALCLQVVTNNKFAGYALVILVLVGQSVLSLLDFTHNLYNFGTWPNAPYSDMNGYGHFLSGQLWFQLYWALFLAALLLLSAAVWVRGTGDSGRRRWALGARRLRGPLGASLAVALLAFAGVGGFLYWNTNVRNDFLSPDARLDLEARYEKEFSKYKDLPQPKIFAESIGVDLHPHVQSMRVHGIYRVRNPHATPITDIHVRVSDDRTLDAIDMGGAKLTLHDRKIGYRIYHLDRPLLPGEDRTIRWDLDVHPRGITGTVAQHQIVDNGSFFDNTMFPHFGYDERGQITDRNERRKRGLGEPMRMPKLEDQAARANNYVSNDADWIDFRATICTVPDQVALAPGYLQKTFERNGQRCFSYAMDRPMLDFYAFLSAKWKVKKGMYKDIPIEIYYDPAHPYNVDRMIQSVQTSLAYYEANFSPYQHRQVRILEFPGYETFAQSFANTIPYSEFIGFITDLRDKDAIDYVFYVTAHEIAHQWWAHQVIGANVQGATMLSESLAEYSSLMVMEHKYGRTKMRRFLKYDLDRYLADRGTERLQELPLYRVEDQQYIHYRKGSLVFYRLREEIGEEALNRALRKFIAAKALQQPPYTTSLELLGFIRAEAGQDKQQLITDLFEKISFYDDRVVDATARKRKDGRYDVSLKMHAAKMYGNGKGKETPARLDDWMDVGVFARSATGREGDEKVLYLERHRITTAEPVIKLVVDGVPFEAGLDPYNKLIDRVSDDNRKRVTLQ